MKTDWRLALELDADRSITEGSREILADAVRRAADLRIYTEFRHNEHVDVTSDNPEIVREVTEFRETYLLQDSWTSAIITTRQPIDLLPSFGPRPSMSFFLYNQDGQQAIARPHLDGPPVSGVPGPSPVPGVVSMPKMRQQDRWDGDTNAPSGNFIYEFDIYRFWVRDDWREVLAQADDGAVLNGSVSDLAEAFSRGAEVKVGIRGLCDDLADGDGDTIDHEVFIHVGSCWYYTEGGLFIGATHPLVRVRPAIPLVYGSEAWDFGWAMVRTDGFAALLLVDPYTLDFRRVEGRYAARWFVR